MRIREIYNAGRIADDHVVRTVEFPAFKPCGKDFIGGRVLIHADHTVGEVLTLQDTTLCVEGLSVCGVGIGADHADTCLLAPAIGSAAVAGITEGKFLRVWIPDRAFGEYAAFSDHSRFLLQIQQVIKAFIKYFSAQHDGFSFLQLSHERTSGD